MDRQRVIEKLRAQELRGQNFTYKLGRELGRGGNGVAILCSQVGGADTVVAKIYIPPDNRDLDGRALERFQNEIAITSKISHPNVVRALDASVVQIATYRLPFYIMPFAPATLRSEIRLDIDPDSVERRFRLFARAAQGVAFLHHNGVIHRDLKPENVLLDQAGNPLVADLGIAHVNPEFVSVGLRTVEAERLLNRDYYAPEQRFGLATAVDQRADVYALGLILYELLSGIPPVRVSPPPLETTSSALAPLDPVWRRMTDWDPEKRFQSVDAALEEAWIAIGLVLATMRGAAGLRNPDLDTMTKLLRSNNDMQRMEGIELAIRLKRGALGHLHTLLGHARRDVRDSVAVALGRIGDLQSIPYLVAALYGNTDKATQFRAAAETAASAIAIYPPTERLRAIALISKPVRPAQVSTILKGIGRDDGFGAARALIERGKLLLDWSESHLGLLVEIDEDRVWPEVLDLVRNRRDFQLREIIPRLTLARRIEVLNQWIAQGVEYSWHFQEQIRLIETLAMGAAKKLELIDLLEQKVRTYAKKFDDRVSLLERIGAARQLNCMLPKGSLRGPSSINRRSFLSCLPAFLG